MKRDDFANKQTCRENLDSLQALRGIASLGVLVSHTGIRCFKGTGAWGVSVFLILSGFLMVYSYYGKSRLKNPSIRNNIVFAKNKIRALYPLHITTTIAMVIFFFIGNDTEATLPVTVKLVLNIFMVQTWFPMEGASINGVSWYLCTAVLTYFLFPWILKGMEKNYSEDKAKRMVVALFFVQIGIGIIGLCLDKIWACSSIGKDWINSDICHWLIYEFPVSRTLDFTIGCNIGYLFLMQERESENERKVYTKSELLTVILILAANICYILLRPKDVMGVTPLSNPAYWWTYTVIFTVSSCMLIWFFAVGKGVISQILTNRITIYFGNISMYIFLIHAVVFRYIMAVCKKFASEKFEFYYSGWIKLTAGFVLTLIATKIWMKLIHKEVRF